MPLADDLPTRRLRVFLCHSSADKAPVRKLYDWLERDGFDPWLDEKKLLPAQRWQDVIEDAVRLADVVLVCLSTGSVSKEGFLQREIKFALQIADEKLDESIYIVPTRLEPVELPRRFREFQAANLYEDDGYEKLIKSLAVRAAQIAVALPLTSSGPHFLRTSGQGSQTVAPSKVANSVRWMKAHARAIALISALVLGGTSLAGFKIYQQQKMQRASADLFYKEALSSWTALDLRSAEILFSQAAAAEPGNPIILAHYALSLNERGNEGNARILAKRAADNSSHLTKTEKQRVEGILDEVTTNWAKAEQIYASIWQRDGKLEDAIRLARVQTLGGFPGKALETIAGIPSPGSNDPRVLLETATTQRVLGNFDQEIKSLDRVIREHSADEFVKAPALAEKCWAYYNSRDQKDALQLAMDACRQAADIFNDKEDSLGQARTLSREALILSDKDNPTPDFPKALELQKRAIEIAKERGSTRDEAGGRQNLANILLQQTPPDRENARTEYEASRNLFESLDDKASMAGLDNDQAVRLIALCLYRDALKSAKQARDGWHEIGSVNEAIALSNQATMEFFLGDLHGAESDLKLALSLADGKLNVDKNSWLITLGNIYVAGGKFSLADQCYRGAPCYDDKKSATVQHAEVLSDAAVDYAAMLIEEKEFLAAEGLAQSALKKAKTEADPDGEAWARLVLANALLSQNKNALLGQAKDVLVGVTVIATDDCRIKVAAGLALSGVYGRAGDVADQKESLANAFHSAQSLGLLSYIFEATLVQAQIDLREGQSKSALQKAEQVKSDAGIGGFTLLSTKASELINQAR